MMNRRTFMKLTGISMVATSLGMPPKGLAQKPPTGKKALKKICVEEHFGTAEYIDLLYSIYQNTYPVPEVIEEEKYLLQEFPFLPIIKTEPHFAGMMEKVCDLDKGRLEDMDKFGIETQVISHMAPGVQCFDKAAAIRLARKINDKLAVATKKHPKRFSGLASIPIQDPLKAADELERAVKDLGFRGVVINSHTKGEYLDDKKYWVIFERAEKLNVPIYLHPRSPSADMIKPYTAYPMLANAVWGFTAETSLHSLRLILSGLFDEFPKLRIILGHLGETLPGMLARIDSRWLSGTKGQMKRLKKLPGQYFRDNFFVSTSGMNEEPAVLISTISILGADRILFATDYPFEDVGQAVNFIDNIPITKNDKMKICHLNAERLFSL